jgi:hypothetical protein
MHDFELRVPLAYDVNDNGTKPRLGQISRWASDEATDLFTSQPWSDSVYIKF